MPDRPHRLCAGWSFGESEYIDWPNQENLDSKRRSPAEARATVRTVASRASAHQKAVEGSQAAAESRWSETERLLVKAAIYALAEERDSFTADDVWAVLADSVPTTPGLAAMLRAATSEGIIEPTDQHVRSRREDRADHDHGRHLRVWRSLLRR